MARAGTLLTPETSGAGKPSQGRDGSGSATNLFLLQLAVLSAAVGAIHLSVAGSHFDYFWLHGVFFVGVGLAQLLWAGLIVASPTRLVLTAGAVGNGLVVATWVVSRTIGVPFGPEPWVAEHITVIDAIATAFEVAIVAGALVALRRGASTRRTTSVGRSFAFGGVVLALASWGIIQDGVSGHVHGGLGELGLTAGGHAHEGSPIAPDDPLLLELETAVRSGGPAAGMDLLEQRAAGDPTVKGLSHQYVHSLSRFAYQIAPDPATAFSSCDDRFEGGCYHGVLQAYFEANPSFTGPEVAAVCTDLGATSELDLEWQCLHGLGHGLTLFFDHNLLRPLRHCDFLAEAWDQRACYGGVFMENVIWAQNQRASQTVSTGEGVIPEDLQYPCNAIADKYKIDCWLMQTSSILDLVSWDFAAAFAECDKAGPLYIGLCNESMGRDIAGYTLHEAEATGSLCRQAGEKWQGSCFAGAAKQIVDFHGGTVEGFDLCSSAPERAKPACHQAMGEMINFYWSQDEARRRAECSQADRDWVRVCEASALVPRGKSA